MTHWTVYIFSDTGKVLFQKVFQARDLRDAERQGFRIVKPLLGRYDNAEDWVVEQTPMSPVASTRTQRIAERLVERVPMTAGEIEDELRARLGQPRRGIL